MKNGVFLKSLFLSLVLSPCVFGAEELTGSKEEFRIPCPQLSKQDLARFKHGEKTDYFVRSGVPIGFDETTVRPATSGIPYPHVRAPRAVLTTDRCKDSIKVDVMLSSLPDAKKRDELLNMLWQLTLAHPNSKVSPEHTSGGGDLGEWKYRVESPGLNLPGMVLSFMAAIKPVSQQSSSSSSSFSSSSSSLSS